MVIIQPRVFTVFFFSSSGSFGCKALVALLRNAELDTLVTGQRDIRLASLANDEDVVQPEKKGKKYCQLLLTKLR